MGAQTNATMPTADAIIAFCCCCSNSPTKGQMDMSASQALKFILGTGFVSPFRLGSCSLARWPIAFATGKCLIWKELDRQRRFQYKMKKKEEESKNNTIEPRAG